MENKKVVNNNPFENLRNLSQVISKNEVVTMLNNLQKVRQTLEILGSNAKIVLNKARTSAVASTTTFVAPKKEEVKKVSQDKKDNTKPFDKNRPQQQRPAANGRPQSPNRPASTKPDYKPSMPSATPLFNKTKNDRDFSKSKDRKNDDQEKKTLNKKAKIKMGYIVENFDDEEEDRIGRVRVKPKKQNKAAAPVKTKIENVTITTDNLTIKLLSEKIGKPVSELIKKCMMLGLMLNINSAIDFDTAELVASEFGITLNKKLEKTSEELLVEEFNKVGNPVRRPPIVTVMGHVDHGKTSLLDTIKKTNVIAGEAGGITQHIGAYSVNVNGNKITFIDTPGHEAFTSMRQRGAQVTDIAILVVAADDGIMPQTIEAIKHIKAANVPMVVAINKMDKPEANPEKVKQQLTEYDVVPEEWGGDTICVPISAKTGMGINKLLESVLLVADILDLKADPDQKGFATVIESKIDKGRGVVATLLVKNGSIHIGDYLLCGISCGRVKAMQNYKGESVKVATPSMAVSIIGLNIVPVAGDLAYVVEEKQAKNIIDERLNTIAQQKALAKTSVNIEEFLATNVNDQIKKYNVLVKADVQGSAEAVKQTLESLKNEEVKTVCVSSGVGNVTETDVLLAEASGSIIIAFNTKTDAKAKQLAEKHKVEIKNYSIIYEAVDFVKEQIDGMLTPIYEENPTGKAEVRMVFNISNVGAVAGSYVLSGVISRNNKVRVVRGGTVVYEGSIESIKQQKDDARQIKEGFECGIRIKGYNDVKEGDILEAFELVEVKRSK